MNYEEKYKTLVAAVKKLKEANPSDEGIQNWVNDNVPELKESKDEKIRKALLEMVHDTTGDELWVDYNIHKEEALAWLEKQGEKDFSWSEEDENGLGDALWAIQQARTIAKDENDMGNLWYAEHWLKSLKARVQPTTT